MLTAGYSRSLDGLSRLVEVDDCSGFAGDYLDLGYSKSTTRLDHQQRFTPPTLEPQNGVTSPAFVYPCLHRQPACNTAGHNLATTLANKSKEPFSNMTLAPTHIGVYQHHGRCKILLSTLLRQSAEPAELRLTMLVSERQCGCESIVDVMFVYRHMSPSCCTKVEKLTVLPHSGRSALGCTDLKPFQ